MSEPNGRMTALEADESDMTKFPSDFASGIAPAAGKGHGEKLIFF